jgi:glycerol kinase
MESDSHTRLKSLKVDGGMVQSELLLQIQADLLGITVGK